MSMTDFPMMKLKAVVNFPANAYGGTGITVNYANGNYVINLDYTKFTQLPLPPDLTPFQMLIWNALTNSYQLMAFTASPYAPINNPIFTGDPQAPTAAPGDNDNSIATTGFVTAAIVANNGITRVVTAAGTVVIAPNDRVVVMNKTVGGPTAVTLPQASTKNGSVVIADFKRDAGTNNITITPFAGELIQGLATYTIAANGASLMLFPLPGVGWSL
jgi:hypothetical protein